MFGVGLHFSLKDLLTVRALAIPGALVQIGGATLLGLAWHAAGLVAGRGPDVRPRALGGVDRGAAQGAAGPAYGRQRKGARIAVGWLIVEDLAMVLALVLIPAIASANGVEAAQTARPVRRSRRAPRSVPISALSACSPSPWSSSPPSSASCWWSGAGSSRRCCTTPPIPAAANCSALPCSPLRSGWRRARPICSAYRWRWARSLPA